MMNFDTILTKSLDDQNERTMIPIPKVEIMMKFINSMVLNLQFLGEQADPSVFLPLGFCRLYKVSHSKFECSHFQEAVARVLTQIIEIKNNHILNELPTQYQNSTYISKVIGKDGEEVEDLNASYSNSSSPPLGMIKIQRRRCFIKGEVWTSVVVHPMPKVENYIINLGHSRSTRDTYIPHIKDKQ